MSLLKPEYPQAILNLFFSDMELPLKKKECRDLLKSMLRTLPEREERSQKLLEALLQRKLLENVRTVSIFVSLPDEVETLPIVNYCWERGLRVLVPEWQHSEKGQRLYLKQWNPNDELMVGRHGIQHPSSGELFELEEVDVVFVPGLAFTKQGHRLGRGMGFYDRLLSQFKGKSIGLCFAEQLKKSVPIEEHDQEVDEVVTC